MNKISPGTSYVGKVIWNIFPVYNQEMSAIANVYCYFDRSNFRANSNWKEMVDDYNQLKNFKSGFAKDNVYKARLNDSALSYTESW